MAKGTALELARKTLERADEIHIMRDGLYHVRPDQSIPAPGRYAVVPVEDMALVLKRIRAAEGAMMLAAAVRNEVKRSGKRTVNHKRG